MNTIYETQAQQRVPIPGLNALTKSILNIANMPSAPTFDWTTQAAKALSPLHQDALFGVVIAQYNSDHNQLNTESSGVCSNSPDPVSSQAEHARSALERLVTTPIRISDHANHSGYVAPITHIFPQCAASKASIPWAPAPPHECLVAFSQIPKTRNTDTNTSITLLLFAVPQSQSLLDAINPAFLSMTLAAMVHKATEVMPPNNAGTIPWLTQREQAILELLIAGNSVRSIAESTNRSPHTIHDHVKNLHRKLGASSRGQLITRALGNQSPKDTSELIKPIIAQCLLERPHNASTPSTMAGIAELKIKPEHPTHPPAAPVASVQNPPKATLLNDQSTAS